MSDSLKTDRYQITMFKSHFRNGTHENEASFYEHFREPPFTNGDGLVVCGIETILNWLEDYEITDDDIDYLKSDQFDLNEDELDYLHGMQMNIDIRAMDEGTIAFPHQPILQIEGPVGQAQLAESYLLHLFNTQSLVATKAARVKHAADNDLVAEFGMRRSHNPELTSRAAYVGGADSTSNTHVGQKYGAPIVGTIAHSWVQFHDNERQAFERYARACEDDIVLLVDTYEPYTGIENAIEVGKMIEQEGGSFKGIRLDSGDMVEQSKYARKRFDEEFGPGQKAVVASSDLDEYTIRTMKEQNAQIDLWGIGTQMVTADDDLLNGVYKLNERIKEGKRQPKMKFSSRPIKQSIPGRITATRYFDEQGRAIADVTHDVEEDPADIDVVHDASDGSTTELNAADHRSLVKTKMKDGQRVEEAGQDSLDEMRATRERNEAEMPDALLDCRETVNYRSGLSPTVYERREAISKELKDHPEKLIGMDPEEYRTKQQQLEKTKQVTNE